jgi:tetratricopeptide (TPR) repeat protein
MHLPIIISPKIKIFFVHSQSRDDERLRKKLEKHLSGLISLGVDMKWLKQEIKGGQDKIRTHLNRDDIIVMLVSPDFVHLIQHDEFWNTEAIQTTRRQQEEETFIVPVLLRSIHGWQNIECFHNLHPLPKNGEAADSKKSWKACGEAFQEVAQGLEETIKELKDYKQRLQEYANQVFQEVQEEYPLCVGALERLQQGQKNLGIREKDAALIKRQTTQEIEVQLDQQRQKLTQQKQQLVWEKAAITTIVAAIVLFFAYHFSSYSSRSAEDFFKQGVTHSINKNFKKAIEDYTQAIQRDSNNSIYYDSRGNAYFFDKNWQKAIDDYTQAIRLDPNNVHAYRYRGEARSNLGDRQGAIEDLRKAARLYTEQGKIYDYQAVKTRIIQLITQRQ